MIKFRQLIWGVEVKKIYTTARLACDNVLHPSAFAQEPFYYYNDILH